MSWWDDMESKLKEFSRPKDYSDAMKKQREDWRWFNFQKQCAEKEMERRQKRFADLEAEAKEKFGEHFVNKHQIVWEVSDKPEK